MAQKFVGQQAAQVLISKIKENATGLETANAKIDVVSGDVKTLQQFDKIKVINESILSSIAISDLEKNVQYNVVGRVIEFGEVLMHNSDTNSLSFLPMDSLEILDPAKNTAIGLVVIPSSHNVYGDGTPGVMALKCARADTPDVGGAEQGISWGEYGTLDLPELPNLTTVPSLAWVPNIMPETTNQQGENGYLCCDFGTVVDNPYDLSRKWSVKNDTHIPSAFLEDGSKNEQFFKGAVSDFDGIGNVAKFRDMTGIYAALDAVDACEGDWYLPAVGEFAYAIMNRNFLNSKLIEAGQKKIESQNHWTSSKHNTSNARCINASNGQVTRGGGNSSNLVRPVQKVNTAGDIGQFWNGSIMSDSYDSTCIGIVIIPTSHDVYGDGSCCVMSLQYATPTGFGAAIGIKMFAFDASEHDGVFVPSSISTPLYCYGVDGPANIEHSTLITPESYSYLPSDAFSRQLSADGIAKYYYNLGPFAPSPYTDSGAKNALYFGQALADFNGKTNTEAILSHVTIDGWQTSTTINNPTISNGGAQSMPIGEFPAACCCWRYSTPGTNRGDWYLPACGELGYCCVRRGAINSILDKINTWSPGSAVKFGASWYWSSSEYGAWSARLVYFLDGLVYSLSRYSRPCVRPFVRVSV